MNFFYYIFLFVLMMNSYRTGTLTDGFSEAGGFENDLKGRKSDGFYPVKRAPFEH